MTFALFEKTLKELGIKRAAIVAQNIGGCPYIQIHLRRQLEFDEIMTIEYNVKACGSFISYWKLPWWKNLLSPFTLIEKDIDLHPRKILMANVLVK